MKIDTILLSNPSSRIKKNSFFEIIAKIFYPFFDDYILDYYFNYFNYFNLNNIYIIYHDFNEELSNHFLALWAPVQYISQMNLSFFREKTINGSIGAIKKIEKYLEGDLIIVFNSGFFPKFNIFNAFEYHTKSGNSVTLLSDNSKSNCIGLIIERDILDFVPEKTYFDLNNNFLSLLKTKNIKYEYFDLENYEFDNFITMQDYLDIHIDFIKNRENIKWYSIDDFLLNKEKLTAIHKTAKVNSDEIEYSVIKRRVFIGKNCIIKNSIIEKNVVIGRSCKLDKCYISPFRKIKKETVLSDTLLEEKERKDFADIKERIYDILLLMISLPITIPLVIIVALLCWIFQGKPIFYIQKRVGKKGKIFSMFKFRTMKKDADKYKEKIIFFNEIDGPMFKVTDDPRITKLGKILRKLSLDELPQLFNILKGDMSFVGPRPLEEKEMRQHPQWREIRLKVKPGLTGLWQVMKSKDNESFSDWIKYDIYYVTHRSLWLYVKIIFLSILSVILRKNK